MKYTVMLNNDTTTFDSGIFNDLNSALQFARGRGGNYNVQIESANGYIALACDSETFSRYNGWEWIPATPDYIFSQL